jgi:hypothetical protein
MIFVCFPSLSPVDRMKELYEEMLVSYVLPKLILFFFRLTKQ